MTSITTITTSVALNISINHPRHPNRHLHRHCAIISHSQILQVHHINITVALAIAGYSRAFPSQALIMVDDGRDILVASRNQVPHLRTIHLAPNAWGPAEVPGRHVYATDLIDLAFRVRSLAQ